jgi:histone deacetylase 6
MSRSMDLIVSLNSWADNVLQGGYNFRSISKSALAVTRTLMGEPPDRLNPTAATPHAVDTVQAVKLIQSRYWRSMYPKGRHSAKWKEKVIHR